MVRVYQIKAPPTSRLGIDYNAQLSSEQHAVVFAADGPTLVLAGAGSGKTRALTYRVARLIDVGVAPEKICLLTFTNRAAREMLRRVEELCGPHSQLVVGGTFHSVACRILRRYSAAIGYSENFSIIDRDDAKSLMGKCITETLGSDVTKQRFPKPDVLLDLASYAINVQKPIRDVVAKRAVRFSALTDDIAKVCRHFMMRKAELNVMDFDDLLVNWKLLLEEGGPVADEIREKTQYILVDEYQDTNPLQAQIVDLMALKHQNVMAVGDDAQCIYGFRGADVQNILGFPKKYSNAKVLPLLGNYRSTPQILALANTTLEQMHDGFAKTLRPMRTEAMQTGMLPGLIPCRDVSQQAAFIASRILELRDEGIALKEMCVLYRAHSHAMEVQMELTRRGIPFLVRSGLRFFERAHIKDVLAYARFASNSADELSLRRALLLHAGVGNATVDALVKNLKPLFATVGQVPSVDVVLPQIRAMGSQSGARRAQAGLDGFSKLMQHITEPEMLNRPGDVIRAICSEFYADYLTRSSAQPDAKERTDDLSQLALYADGYSSVGEFLNELSLVQSIAVEDVLAGADPDEKLTLSSVHQAKGLEWRVVFLIWLTEGAMPSELALRDAGGEDEERRLFYVAATRAKDELMMCYPMTSITREYGMILQKKSRFVVEIEQKSVELNNNLDPATPPVELYELWQIS